MTEGGPSSEEAPAAPTAPEVLDRITVVLDEPQNLVNVAGVVRAMKNMGLRSLHLVRPAEFDAHRITGIAHRSEDVVEAARITDTLEDALADAVFVVGTTARARTARRNYVRPRKLAPELVDRAREGRVALLFGREDRGLSNEALDLCHRVAIVPTDPEYSSLNLAQACLLLCYEVFLAAGGGRDPLPEGKREGEPASQADLAEMYGALESGLERIEFFKARSPDTVLRTLRTLLGRAEPGRREARLVAAVGYEIGNYIDRTAPTEADDQ